jgi:cytoskeletal protein RodZ
MEQADAERSLGSLLRSLREARNGSLEEMARSTRVGIRQLEALESDNLSELPAPVFVRGFIRAYCSFLNASPDEALGRYRDMLGERAATEASAPPVQPASSWSSSPVLVSLALLVVFGLGLLAVNGMLRRPPRAAAPPASTPVAVEASKVPTGVPPEAETPPAASAEPRPSVAAPPATPVDTAAPKGSQRLVVRAMEPTWIRVQTDDGRVAEELLPAGATREWTSAKRFVVTVGNAGGIEVELNGRLLPPLGARGAVIQRLELPQAGS